jgi:hypothetical protein
MLNLFVMGFMVAVPPQALAVGQKPLDITNANSYESAHRALASAVSRHLRTEPVAATLAQLRLHQRELPLREICSSCDAVAKRVGADRDFEPSAWLYDPANREHAASAGETLIAFPPAGDERSWSKVDALTVDGHWVSLDVQSPPEAPVIVVRVNGKLSLEKQIGLANTMLRDAGLQSGHSLAAQAKGSGRWTTSLESIRLNNDQEPWVSGAAEVYAITSGVLPGNEPQVAIVDMPYLDHDGTIYSPRQVILDWANYSFGVANIQFYEHDDNTNFQQLVLALIQAVAAGGTLAGQPEVTAIAEIAGRIVQAMPAGWFANDDDYVDSLYSIEKLHGETNRLGAAGNVRVTYVPYELPVN